MREAILYHLVSGHAWFTAGGVILLLFVLELGGIFRRRPAMLPVARVLLLLAIGVAALSGTAVPLPILVPLVLALGAVVATSFREQMTRTGAAATALALLLVLVAAANEARWHRMPPTVGGVSSIIVLGDSLSSGGFGEAAPWPRLVEQMTSVPVVSLASPGETTASAVRGQLPLLAGASPVSLVIVELGGNDLLGEATLEEFATSLDAILSSSAAAGERVVMFELPIPAGRWAWGSTQRRLARRHGALMIPKRVLARLVSTRQMVSDGLHPTDAGHRFLAAGVAQLVGGDR